MFVVEDPESPRIDPGIIAHEVGHSWNVWESDRVVTDYTRQDRWIAAWGMIEGYPDWIEERYLERCGDRWDCIERPGRSAPSQDVNMGLYVTFAAPYVLGDQLMETMGPRTVWRRQPVSSEQLVHPRKWEDDEQPTAVEVRDRSAADWEPIPLRGDTDRTQDRVGEMVLYTMFWNAGLTDDPDVTVTVQQETGLDYHATRSAGWDDDAFVAYTNGTANGYVLATAWDTEADAREFHEAYRRLLGQHGAERVDEHTWVIDFGPFADAFRVQRTNRRVVIVNAPTVDALDDVHAVDGSE